MPDLPQSSLVAPSDRRWIIAAVVVFSGLSLWGAITSRAFLEADSCTHYMYARAALQDSRYWHYLVNVWGRPVCTGLYALPALVAGRMGVRVFSLLLALTCSWLAYLIARRQGRVRPVLAMIFTLAQPLVFLHSFSELTELPFAALLVLGFWAYQRRWWGLMALAIGFTPASRPEGFGFLLLAGLALLLHRRAYWLPLLLAPLVAWDVSGWILYGKQVPWWMWLISEWPYAGTSLYESGPWYHFLRAMPAVVGPFIFPMVGIGVWLTVRRHIPLRRGRAECAHARRVDLLIAIIPLLIFVGHSTLYALGRMASSGELRYMMIVAPFWALLAADGWTWAMDRLSVAQRYRLRAAALAACLPFGVNLIYPVVPLKYMSDWDRADRFAEWYRASDVSSLYPHIAASHPGIFYFLDRPVDAPDNIQWLKETLMQVPEGTLLIWDPTYGIFNADQRRKVPLADIYHAGWVPLSNPPADIGEFRFFHSKPTPTGAPAAK